MQISIPRFRFAMLYVVFFLIAAGLGYPALNRYDPRLVPGLSDVQSYAAMVTGTAVPGPDHMKFRVLIPWMARPLYRVAEGRVGSWDPVMFALVAVDSFFVAATALLIVRLGTRIRRQLPDCPDRSAALSGQFRRTEYEAGWAGGCGRRIFPAGDVFVLVGI